MGRQGRGLSGDAMSWDGAPAARKVGRRQNLYAADQVHRNCPDLSDAITSKYSEDYNSLIRICVEDVAVS